MSHSIFHHAYENVCSPQGQPETRLPSGQEVEEEEEDEEEDKEAKEEGELPEAPWGGAWRAPQRRHRWRRVRKSGGAVGVAWGQGRSEGNPAGSCGSARPPGRVQEKTGVNGWKDGPRHVWCKKKKNYKQTKLLLSCFSFLLQHHKYPSKVRTPMCLL